MAKPRQCPDCPNGIIKNYKALRCWNCYNIKVRPTQNRIRFKSGFGDKHHNWKGGKWLYWRRQALKRDDYTCQKCGLRDEEIMDVDHIIPKRDSSQRFKWEIADINNLQVLCPNCHKRKSIQEQKFHSAHLKSR